MINSEKALSIYTISKDISEYEIGFRIEETLNNVPSIKVFVNKGLDSEVELLQGRDFTYNREAQCITIDPTIYEGEKLYIFRAMDIIQDSDYQVGNISSSQIEEDFDKTIMKIQQLKQDLATNVEEIDAELERLSHHNYLQGREEEDCHPIEAITDLRKELDYLKTHNNLEGRANPDCHPMSAISGLLDILGSLKVHSFLAGREVPDSHPISAITGLQRRLDDQLNHKNLLGRYDANAHPMSAISGLNDTVARIDESIKKKLDKQQGAENYGKALVVGKDGQIVLSTSSAVGLTSVAHDDTLEGLGTEVEPLKAKQLVAGNNITIDPETRVISSEDFGTIFRRWND